jgi:hypothetical protein
MPDMHLLNPPATDEIYYLINKYDEFCKMKIVKTLLSSSGDSMLVHYLCAYGYEGDLDDAPTYGTISLHHWNCWLRDSKMTKINNPQEELAFILKYGCK